MLFSVVTPSFRQPEWLRLCCASVRDQEGVEVEHIVQDNRSGPEVEAVLGRFPSVRLFVEKDEGMYDAINRGLGRARGSILGYLNCDEQYLPGALSLVAEALARNPEAEVAFGDLIVVDARGRYVCHRETLAPDFHHTALCHSNLYSCTVFFRRGILDRGLAFDPRFRVAGDAEWVLRLLGAGVRMVHVPAFLAVFTDTGENQGYGENAEAEMRRLGSTYAPGRSWLRALYAWHHRLRRVAHGHYLPKRIGYSIYTTESPDRRVPFEVRRSRFLWKRRFTWLR